MLPEIGASLIGAGSNFLTSLGNLFTQKKLAKDQFKYQQQLLQQQNDYNTQMWNMSNEYNSPSAQVQRYSDAGLNPGFMMSGQSASTAPSVQSANPSFAMPGNPSLFGSLGSDMINLYLSAKQAAANINKTNAEADETRSRIPKNEQDVLTGKSAQLLNEANTRLVDLQAKWEDLSRDDRLHQLHELVENLKKTGLYTDKEIEKLSEENKWIAPLSQSQLDLYIKQAEKANQEALTEAAERNKISKEVAVLAMQAKLLEQSGKTEEYNTVLKLLEAKRSKLEVSAQKFKNTQELVKAVSDIYDLTLKQRGLSPGDNYFQSMMRLGIMISKDINEDLLQNAKDLTKPSAIGADDSSSIDALFEKIIKSSIKQGHLTHSNPKNYFAYASGK